MNRRLTVQDRVRDCPERVSRESTAAERSGFVQASFRLKRTGVASRRTRSGRLEITG